jgi:CPA2 family monovalent cation:H+ antiporter-2
MSAHTDISGLALVALAALVCGIVLTRFRQPALVGYILAGIVLGPSALGLVENRGNVAVLAELGVLVLLFLVGMKLSLRAFRAVYKIALMAAGLQIVLSVALTLAFSQLLGWSIELSVLLGFVISLSSTAVAIRMMEEIGELRTDVGQRVVGVLIAQDIAVVPMLLLLGSIGGGEEAVDWQAIPAFIGGIGFLVGLIWFLGRRERWHLPLRSVMLRYPEITPIAALTYCFALAALSGVLGRTAAYGAFIAGLFIGTTTERRHMIRATEPIESILVMMFFLSIGLLIDLSYIWSNIGTVITLLLIVMVGKTALNIGILRLLGEPWPRAFLAGLLLGQIGEFSFVLAGAGIEVSVIDSEGYRLVIAVIALSLMVSPLWFETARRLHRLTQQGISRFDELLVNLYDEEARLVAAQSTRAARGTWLRLRLLQGRAFKRPVKADTPEPRVEPELPAVDGAVAHAPPDAPEPEQQPDKAP